MVNYEKLQAALKYKFKDIKLLQRALTHRSHGMPHNERLEFLGDSILNFVVSTLLFAEHTEMNEGDLSRVRSNLVKQSALAEIANTLELSSFLRLGEGELKSGGFNRPSILSDAVEAIFGAIYLDGDYMAVRAVIEHLYRPLLEHMDTRTLGKDAKTYLQELVQGKGYDLPNYEVVNMRGVAHDQTFDVVCEISQLNIQVKASGTSRRAAEQLAAGQAIKHIESLGSLRHLGKKNKRHKEHNGAKK